MTVLKQKLRRETATTIWDGGKVLPIVIEVYPDYVMYRQKGRRCGYMLPHRAGYLHAVNLAVEEERREKRERRRR